MRPLRRIREEIEERERPPRKYLLVLVLAIAALGGFVIAAGGSVEQGLYMRGDTQTVNEFSGYKLNASPSDTQQSTFVESSNEGDLAEWGLRAWKIDENSSETEITGGSPVAVVSRSTEGSGIQSASYTPPVENLNPNDAIIFRVYIRVGGGSWSEEAEFVSNRLNASQVLDEPWNVNYFTQYETQGGPPFNQFTRGTFYWGTTTYDSRVEGFNYTLASVEAEQTAPQQEVETYPGQGFDHEVSVTCSASYCEDVEAVPQVCQGRSCTSFQSAGSLEGLSWNKNSHSFGKLERDETTSYSFDVTAEEKGDYRIKFQVNSSNVLNNDTDDEVVDVHIANVSLTDLEHENQLEHSVNQYETSDTLEFVNTTLLSENGTAFNLTVSPKFLSPSNNVASWGPQSREDCGNLSEGSTCEREFLDYSVPVDAEEGVYTVLVDYDWENFGPGSNDSYSFEVIDIRNNLSSSLGESSIQQGGSTEYNISFTNKWDTDIQDVNISINCPSGLECGGLDQNFFSSVNSGSEIESSFNVSSSATTETGFYDINATVEYTNPDETKNWEEVENSKLKVTSDDVLLTDILDVPETAVRGDNLTLDGNLENQGSTSASEVWLNWTLETGWTNTSGDLNVYRDTVDAGELVWNNITAKLDLTASRGSNYINLTSNNSDGTRGDKSFEIVDVYGESSLNLDLNASDVSRGDKVTASTALSLDTGQALQNQRITLKDNYSGDPLGSATTDSNGEAVIEFEVPGSWNVTNHTIEANYEGNDTIYTTSANDTGELAVHDLPQINGVNATPQVAGLGKDVLLEAQVTDEDSVKDVYANVTYPDGTYNRFTMSNTVNDTYARNFSETWQNGIYKYRIEAEDDAGYSSNSEYSDFQSRGNATIDAITDRDVYGPNEDVLLERTDPTSRNSTDVFRALTGEQYADELFSESFDTLTGTSTFHTETHDADQIYFNMTEQNGEPPTTPDRFEGIYTYSTDLSNLSRMRMSSRGKVDGGTWDVQVRNYNTASWENVFSISETTDVWDNNTICAGSGCSDYISNGEIDIRVFTESDRGTTDYTYSADYQRIRVETNEGPKTIELNPPDEVAIGKDRLEIKRHYTKLDLGNLPAYTSGKIENARLIFNVSSGFGTGEIHHTRNFTSADSAETIYSDGEPSEQDDANPVATFNTDTGMKSVDVTDAINDTYESGKQFVGLQFREQAEDNRFYIEGPAYVAINYTANSEIFNTGNRNFTGYLIMRVQRNEDGSWSNVGFPVVDQSAGEYPVNSNESFDLSSIWESNGGFNTQLREPGRYRVLTRYTDPDASTLVTDTGKKIEDNYEFQIDEAELNLTDVEHENQYDYLINEYETTDNIDWVNVTVNNSETEAVNASIDLNVLDETEDQVSWGPDSLRICGDIPEGGSCEERWDNQTSGYTIPSTASDGTFEFRWNTTLEAENSKTVNNYSIGFFIHHVPDNFGSEILDSDNKILRNESAVYNFTVGNPWSGSLESVNVTVNCPDSVSCEEVGGIDQTAQIGTLGSGRESEVSFNMTTDENTPTGDYDINASVEYVNPGNERKEWNQRENKILQVRIPGALLNITETPEQVDRGGSGYDFSSFANNTYEDNLTDETLQWEIPEGWNNETGNLTTFEEVHEPGELVWDNFTAEVFSYADLGVQRINVSVTNDQGREDTEFVDIGVYSPTSTTASVSETDPAPGEVIQIEGLLEYQNGTGIEDQEIIFRDEATGEQITTGFTDSSGIATGSYNVDKPYGNHTLNVSYRGSNEKYTRSSYDMVNITVRDRPNITSVSADPLVTGFGQNVTINTSVTDREGVEYVNLTVEQPDGQREVYNMSNITGDWWQYNYTDTWKYGTYSFEVKPVDSYGKVSTNYSEFIVFIGQKSGIQTLRDDYYPAEYVNLTEGEEAWWNKSWDFRKKIQVNETSGNDLVQYPSMINVSGLDAEANCEDIRVVENQQLKDLYVDQCDPGGNSIIYFSSNTSASASEEDVFLYYGNPNASAYNDELHAYRISDAGVYSPGEPSIDNTDEYNGGNASFRQIQITVFGSSLEANVQAYNYRTGSFDTLYSGNPADGQTIVDQFYLADPKYSRVDVQLTDTSNNPDPVSYEYNYTTPGYTSIFGFPQEDSLDSTIQNTGNTTFEGRVLLEVERNTSGSWETVETQNNDTDPRTLQPGQNVNFANLWNDNPFYTGSREQGFYRAMFKFLGPEGNVLTDAGGQIIQDYVFRLNPPRSDVNIDQIEIYNVTESTDMKSDTGDLEDSGRNTTLSVYGGDIYRFDVTVNNSEDASSSWDITGDELVRHFNFNSSWQVNSSNIFYDTGTTYTGGSYNGTVEWDTTSGTVDPGENATFSFIIEIPNVNEERDILYEIDDPGFTVQDISTLKVVERENQPPTPLDFNLNRTVVRGDDDLQAYAEWSEEIGSGEAEYNSTTEILNNFTATTSGPWTNHTTSTSTDWLRGNHSFRFYATDLSGNTNATLPETFQVFASSSINNSQVNTSEAEPGEPVRYRCRVIDDRNDPISNYNVSFYENGNLFDWNTTVSEGWASSIYSSNEIGSKNLTCVIDDDEDRYYQAKDNESTENIAIFEERSPKFFDVDLNRTKIFKTTLNNTAGFKSYWTDNRELSAATLIEGLGFYPTNVEKAHRIENTSGYSLLEPLNGTNPIDEGFDSQDHWVYGTTTGENSEKLDVYHGDGNGKGWNNTFVANRTQKYCSFQTSPVNTTDCEIRPSGLTGFWTMDETGVEAWDHVGKNHGELKGGITQGARGQIGASYDFDGSDDYINLSTQVSDSLDSSSFTWTAWIKNPGTATETIIAANTPSGTERLVFRVNDRLELRRDGSTYTSDSSAVNSDWIHVAVAVNSTDDQGTFYINGSRDGTFSTAERIASGDIFSIGQTFDGSISDTATSDHFDGKMDGVRVYNRTLTRAEISALESNGARIGESEEVDPIREGDQVLGKTALSGTQDWSNFTVDMPDDLGLGPSRWSIPANDTSKNYNRTDPIGFDIWAWAFVDDSGSGPDKNPVAQGEEFTFYCNYKQGNGTGISGYPVTFWDNNTADGSFRRLGENSTQDGNLLGFAQWTQSYTDIGAYKFKCNATKEPDQYVEPFEGFESYNETIEVSSGDVEPPVIINDNYRLNTSSAFKEEDAVLSVAQWNETIDTAWVEYNTSNTTFKTEFIEEPYTDEWTNYTFTPGVNWSVGEHWIKTYANDTAGNVNDTLEFLKYDVWGRSRAEWISPTGDVEQGNTELVCGVYDDSSSEPIESYEVGFYDDNNDLIGTNTTGADGEASYFYNTSELSTGEKTWSCRIENEPDLFYNTSDQDTTSETVNLVEEIQARLVGSLVEPPSTTTVAQNRTFDANVSVTCQDGDCGTVNTTLRYNSTGTEPDTAIQEGSGEPFYTVGSNPASCDLNQGETCYVDYEVNATGAEGSEHSMDALLESDSAENNDTENSQVTIDVVLLLNVTYSNISYGRGKPGEVLEAPGNNGEYVVKLDNNSNDATGGLWFDQSNLTRLTGDDTENRRIRPQNTSWAFESSCSYTGSNQFKSGYFKVLDILKSGDSVSNCFWQEIPYGKYSGTYNGTLTIKVNRTE